MAQIYKFIFQVICCAFICAILNRLLAETRFQPIIKLVGALVLTLMIIQPILNYDFGQQLSLDLPLVEDAAYYRNIGEEEAQRILQQRIKEELETYILAEAKERHADITVDVIIGEENLPEKIYLYGKVSPETRNDLGSFLESNLSVPKENQIWTG